MTKPHIPDSALRPPHERGRPDERADTVRVLDYLQRYKGDRWTAKQIARWTGLTPARAEHALQQLVDFRMVKRHGVGSRHSPYTYTAISVVRSCS
jgi:predicted transcriptional regulator